MPVEPTLTEVIREAIESRLLDLHTSLPGVVVTYNPLLQTADVQPAIKRARTVSSGETEHEQLPIIHNVPVAFPVAGGYALQLPILPGDHVWLSFSEAATAQWRSTGQISEPGDLRRHDLSYACAFPIAGPDSDALEPLVPPTEARMDCSGFFTFASGAAGQALALPVARSAPIMTALAADAAAHAAMVTVLASMLPAATAPAATQIAAYGAAVTALAAAVTAATATSPSTALKA